MDNNDILNRHLQTKNPTRDIILKSVIVGKVTWGPVYTKHQCSRCDEASNTTLIGINRVTPDGVTICYRPHPKDDGRLCFHKNLSFNTPGGGRWYPHPTDRGFPHPANGGTPSFLIGVYPILPVRGVPPSFPMGTGTPILLTGVPPSCWWGVTPPLPLGLDGGTPYQDLMGVPPPSPYEDSSIASTSFMADFLVSIAFNETNIARVIVVGA